MEYQTAFLIVRTNPSETLAALPDDGLRLNDQQRVFPGTEDVGEDAEGLSVGAPEARS